MRLRTALCLSIAVVACGRQVQPGGAHAPSGEATPQPTIRLNGYAIDVKGRPPLVPLELEASDELAASLASSAVPGLPVGADLTLLAKPGGLAAKQPKDRRRSDPARKKWLVQFGGPIHQANKAELEALGVRIGDYVPQFAFVVSMDDDTRAAVEALPFVRGVVRYKPAYKLARRLTDATGSVRADLGPTVKVRVRADGPDGLPALLSEVHDQGGKVLRVQRDVAQAEVAPASLVALARREEVLWIEEVVPARLLNDTSRWTIQSFVDGSTPMSDGGLDGAGQIVGVGDSGLDHDSCWFRDPAGVPIGTEHRKVVGYASYADERDGDSGHGTHVSGTVAGNQAPITGNAAASGMAPGARIFMTDLSPGETGYVYPPDDLGLLFIAAYQAGARIHTNSWGAGWNWYETNAWSTDRFMWEHKDFLVLFANGNSGPGLRSVGFPATAKNVISVGATENGERADHVASFSSNGPAADGRTKPTLTAPGVAIRSADSDGVLGTNNCGTVLMSGTSMATPTVAGAAALVRQYYADGYWPSGMASPADALAPSAALVKATLLNAAQSASGEYTDGPAPSTGQGWGRVNLSRTLRFAGDATFLDVADVSPGLATGDTWSKQFFATGGLPVKVSVVWTDYPGAQFAETELVNDLDLVVVAPDGTTTYVGNVFSGGASVTGGAPDRLNVEEQVLLPVSERGWYTVRVDGYNVPSGPQPFAVVVTGAGGLNSRGFIGLDRRRYGASTTVEIKVGDQDLNTQPQVAEEVFVTIQSAAGPEGESVRLVETGPDSAIFSGTIPTGHGPGTAGDEILAVADGGAIVAAYLDENDGTGVPGTVTAVAVGDLVPPAISGVFVSAIGQADAEVSWTTSEPTDAAVLYGKTPALGATATVQWLAASHHVSVGSLEEGVTYLYAVRATDEAGNVTFDDAGGALRTFTTLVLPPDLAAFSSRGQETNMPDTVVFGTAVDPSDVASLTVNGLPVPVRASDGYFEASVPLAVGENVIAVVAVDGLGQTASKTLAVRRLPLPDLVVTSVTAPETVGIGMPFSARVDVCNVGPGDVTFDYWSLAWFLSEDEVFGEGDFLVSWPEPVYSPIPSGGCTWVTRWITPDALSLLGRPYHLVAWVLLEEPEENPDDNEGVAETWTTFEPPDLTVTAITAPPRAGTAAPFELSTTMTNAGLGKAIAVFVNVYVSTDDTITTSDRLVATHEVPIAGGGAVATTTTSVVLPCDLPAGSYRLGAIVDPQGSTLESNEANNVLAGPTLVVDGPDLALASMSGPTVARTGETVTFRNVVTASATGGGASTFRVGIYASPDPIVTTSDAKLGERTVASLAAGASSAADTVVTIPQTWPGGTYHVGAIADTALAILETDEANNTAVAAPLTVLGPDLVAGPISAQASASVGEVITVEESVRASDAGGAAPAVEVGLYLSADPSITPADLLVGWRSVPPLASGASSVAATQVTIPVHLSPGTYYVGAIADDFTYCWEDELETQHCVGGDRAKEPIASNNVAVTGPIAIGGTDLTMTDVSAPGTAASGMPLVVNGSVAASGGGAGPFRIGYYLSADVVISTADAFLGYRTVSGLAPGGSSAGETTVTVPAGLVPGTYHLGAIADYQGAIAETSETNNARAGGTVIVVGPDLTISSVLGPPNAGTGAPFSVTTTVANVGAGASPASFVEVYLSPDAIVTTADRRLAYTQVGAIAPGASATWVATVTIPSNEAPGTYYLGAIVDRYNTVKESVESNNSVAGSTVVLAVPDLEPTAIAGPLAAATGEAVTVSYTLAALPTGGGATNASVAIFLSVDDVVTSQDVYLGERSLGPLASGTSSSGTLTVSIPTGIAGGTYHLGALADRWGATPETCETNNGLAGNTIDVTGPDLVATAASGPASGARGSSFSVFSSVAAAAAGGAAPGFYVGVFLSTDAAITPADVIIGHRWVPGLSPGSSSSEAILVTVPPSLAAGTYHLGILVDDFELCTWENDFEECVTDAAKEPDGTNNAFIGGTIVVTP